MTSQIRITRAVARVLREFLTDDRPRYGYDLMQATGYPSGKLYPILALLVDAGWLIREQEHLDRDRAGKPARYLYMLSQQGDLDIQREFAASEHVALPPHQHPSAPQVSRPRSALGSDDRARDRARR